ncbi:MAG: hypothetical protein VX789_03050 [Candidatus Neomarinimicrobiota bacterium]|jgi:hypothetical protein|nr:hypothetical protein [Candidatus Neomarinimicrobiota bacterium]
MNRYKLIILTLPIVIFAQSDLYPVEDYYGGGIGYSPMYMILDSIPGASKLRQVGVNPDNFNSPFVIHGGEGFTQISGRWRLGGYAGIGTSRISNALSVLFGVETNGIEGIQTTANDTSQPDLTEKYTGIFVPTLEAKFTFMISAITLEYVVPIFRDLEIASGAMFGVGRTIISIDQNTGTPRWDASFSNNFGQVINDTLIYTVDATGTTPQAAIDALQGSYLPPQTSSAGMTNLSGTFFNFQPYVAVKWQITDRVGLRLSIGFNKGVIRAGQWKLNDRFQISDSPESALSGLSFRTMIYFGL